MQKYKNSDYDMKSGIYAITNLINNKKYIGQSVDVNRRIIHHRHHLNVGKHYNEHLQRAWDKYGKDNFSFEILEYCDIDELDDLERKYISELNTMDDKFGYNTQSGGHEGKELSEEIKKKLSELSSGKNNPMYGVSLFGEKNGMYNKNHSDESKQKMSETKSRTYNSTGFFKVHKHKDDRYLNGFRWHYQWTEEGKSKQIASVSLLDLEKKVRAKGLHWEILDEKLAKEAIEEDKQTKKTADDYNKLHSSKVTTTGIFRVSKKERSSCKQGFIWSYTYTKNKKRKTLLSVSLSELEQKVKNEGLIWEIVDEDLAKQTIKEDKKIKNSSDNYIKFRNTTGVFRVSKKKNKKYKKGFIWTYTYSDENKKRKTVMSSSLIELKKKVEDKGFDWEILDEELAKKTTEEDKQ